MESNYKEKDNQKVLFLASVASMIDLFNKDNLQILMEKGYEVDVVANFQEGSITSKERVSQYWNELKKKGVKPYDVPIPRSIYKIRDIITSYRFVKELVNQNNYKIVHCHSPIGGVICRLACIRARKQNTKVIYTAHGFHFYKGARLTSWLVYYPIELICSRFTDMLITINKEDYIRAKKYFSCDVEYVPGIGIHVTEFSDVSIDRIKKREELGLSKDDFVFMSTGQLSKRKNHSIIIKALGLIDDSNVKYMIVGFGELEDELKKLCEQLGLRERVVFLGYREDVNELLHVSDAFAFPSLQEGLPVSLMEAMATKLPVVCSNIRGNVDLIVNNEGGYVCEPKDVDAFAEAMKKIISTKTFMMGNININVMQEYDSKIINQRMKKLYDRAIEE